MGGLAGRFPGTKFVVPRVPVGLVARPELVAGLARDVMAVPLTLLSAPAGYGKTVLGVWLASDLTGARVCWVSVDADDNDPRRLLAAMTAALRGGVVDGSAGPSLDEPMGVRLRPGGVRRAVIALLNDVARLAEPVVFVLDELEAVIETAVYQELGRLVERAPANLHVVVVTRHNPPLALARLRARGLLAERGVPELRFTEAEVADLVNGRLDLDLGPDEVRSVYQRTEGWPAGVRLLAASLGSSDASGALERLPAGNRQVFEFLAEEVFDRQPPEVRRFLVQTSVLSTLTASTSTAVSGVANAADLLDGLDQRGLFVMEHGGEGTEPVYRYHELFARFLRWRLDRWPAGQRAELRRRAAAVEQDPAAAAGHLLAAGDAAAAADLLASEGERLLRLGRAASLRDLLGQLPAEQVAARPRLLATRGELAFAAGDVAGARRAFEQAESAFTRPRDAAERATLRARLAECVFLLGDVDGSDRLLEAALEGPLDTALRVRLLLTRAQVATNRAGAEVVSEQALGSALELVANGDRHTVEVAVSTLLPGVAALRGGVDQVERFCDLARRVLPAEAGAARLQVQCLAATTDGLRGRIREADAVLGQALRGFDVFGGPPPFLAYQVAFLRVLCAQALLPAAALDPVLGELERRALPLAADNVRTPNRWFIVGRARFLQGRFDALREARARLVEARPGPAFLGELNRLVLDGLVACADGDRRGAERAMLQAVAVEDGLRLVNVFGSARISLACLYLQFGRPERALRVAEPALAVCARQRLPGRVLFEGRRVVPLLRLAIDHGIQAPLARELASRLREPASAGFRVPETGQRLTAREAQILGLLAAGMTNPEIAERLTIGEETVKTHVARVLRKLGVRSRAAAAVRAHQFGITAQSPPATSA